MKVVVTGILIILLAGIAAAPAAPAPDLGAAASSTAGIVAPEIAAADFAGAAFLAAERARIRGHLLAVERHLRAVDVSHLSPGQRQARAAAIDHLREYREAGTFPHNHHASYMTPLFRDVHGTLCAMAYLIERSGAGSLVDRVAGSANEAYVRDLAEDPELVEWLERNGMTAAEAALVQPMYGPGWPDQQEEEPSALVRNYGVVGATLFAADAVALYLNRADAPPAGPARALLGVGTGLTSSVTGILALNEGVEGAREGLALANIGFGAVAAALGAHALITGNPAPGQKAFELPGGVDLSVRAAPIAAAHYRPGLHLSARF